MSSDNKHDMKCYERVCDKDCLNCKPPESAHPAPVAASEDEVSKCCRAKVNEHTRYEMTPGGHSIQCIESTCDKCGRVIGEDSTLPIAVAQPEAPAPERKTAEEWNKDESTGLTVFDPDGWPRHDPEEFQRLWYKTPVTREEFMQRAMTSTCRYRTIPHPAVPPSAAPGAEARQPKNLTTDPYALDKFWWWCERTTPAFNGAFRIDENWRVDEVATAFAAYDSSAKDAQIAALQGNVDFTIKEYDAEKSKRKAAEADNQKLREALQEAEGSVEGNTNRIARELASLEGKPNSILARDALAGALAKNQACLKNIRALLSPAAETPETKGEQK